MKKGEYYMFNSTSFTQIVRIDEIHKNVVYYSQIIGNIAWAESKVRFEQQYKRITVVKIKIPAKCLEEVQSVWSKNKINHIPNKQWSSLLEKMPQVVMLYDGATSRITYVVVKAIVKRRQLNEDIITLEWEAHKQWNVKR